MNTNLIDAGRRLVASMLLAAMIAAFGEAAEQRRTRPENRQGERNTPPARGERFPDRVQTGDAATDFTLPLATGKGEVSLASFCGKKPVVLIFGSYSCPPFRREVVDLESLHQTYGGRVQFLMVYIREAHPDSVVRVIKNGRESLEKIEQTTTLAERSHNAQQCTATLNLSFPAVLDKPDNKVNAAYAAWPSRLAIVGTDGRLAYYSGPGPRGFQPREVAQWLRANVK